MKFLFASDSFKGTLSSKQTAELLEKAAKEIFPEAECVSVEVADGGEGTTDAVISGVGGERVPVQVHGPLSEVCSAYYGIIDKTHAVMEMAAASGLPLVPASQRDPGKTTSYGTGEMIRDALDRGIRDISIAIGGSATNDGGMGCMRALGVRFIDEQGRELSGCGNDLIHVKKIDLSGMDSRISECCVTVMCDVSNPLCGENGATYTFGAQKGATPEMLDLLEQGMQNYSRVILEQFGVDMNRTPGAGAAGGLGAALMVFLNGKLKSGIETVLDLIDFDRKLQDVSLVVTGEGATDWQSAYGKVIQGIGLHCREKQIPAVAVVGSMGKGAEDIYDYGIDSIITTVNAVMPLQDALDRAEELYLNAARRLFRMLRAGTKI